MDAIRYPFLDRCFPTRLRISLHNLHRLQLPSVHLSRLKLQNSHPDPVSDLCAVHRPFAAVTCSEFGQVELNGTCSRCIYPGRIGLYRLE